MKPVSIEFFHDTICSFCFPMSYEMRRLQEQLPEVKILHRSFALVGETEDFDRMFGSRAAAKDEILTHWEKANAIDPLHRFNIEGMRRADFPFPGSMPALLACKAAWFTGGDAAYWDAFDALQKGLFVQSRNTGDEAVIEEIIRETGLGFDLWKQHREAPETREAVETELALARRYGIDVVPTLIINGQYPLSGVVGFSELLRAVRSIAEEGEG